jgi:Ulp1 family protease
LTPQLTSSRLSTPQLLASFQQLEQPQQPQQPHNEVINTDNGNEMSLVIDIPDANFDDANNNNNANNSNLNLNAEQGLESSPDSQLGSM